MKLICAQSLLLQKQLIIKYMSTYLNEGIECRQAHYVFQTFQVPKFLTECIIKHQIYITAIEPHI